MLTDKQEIIELFQHFNTLDNLPEWKEQFLSVYPMIKDQPLLVFRIISERAKIEAKINFHTIFGGADEQIVITIESALKALEKRYSIDIPNFINKFIDILVYLDFRAVLSLDNNEPISNPIFTEKAPDNSSKEAENKPNITVSKSNDRFKFYLLNKNNRILCEIKNGLEIPFENEKFIFVSNDITGHWNLLPRKHYET